MVPVSGKFQPDHREAWDLVIRAFRAGVSVVREGATTDDVNAAFKRSVQKDKETLRTPLARHVAEELAKSGDLLLHGAGIECCETPIKGPLRNGMVVVFEPGVEADGQFFHLEDMLLVKQNGYEVLTAGFAIHRG